MVLCCILCAHLQPSAHKDASAQASVTGSSPCAQSRVGRKLADAAEGLYNLVQSIALKRHQLERPPVLHFPAINPFLNPLHLMKALG